MIKKMIVTSCVLAILSPVVSASTAILANKTITGVTTYNSIAVIGFTPAATGTELIEGCEASNNVVLNLSDTTKEHFSLILAAYMAKLDSVGFGVSGCREGNGNNYPVIYRVGSF